MIETKISTRGRVVLPKAIRDKLGWHAGTTLDVEDGPDGVLLKLVAKKARRVALADKPRKRRKTASARR
jgi:AbrB family looped-hinge helix DNA binding protein